MHTTASTAGLILSLSSSLPRSAKALQRRAHAIAGRLERPHGRSLDQRAADLLCTLLSAADGDLDGYPTEGCLDADFDNLAG